MAPALEGRVALVTGGGWNVGRAVALRFAREGARVVVAGRNEERLAETVELARAAGGEASASRCDVLDLSDAERVVAHARERYGPPDVLAAIAGGGGGYEPIDAVDPEWWAHVVALNLVGTFHSVRAVLPGMRARGAGAILMCSGGGAFFPMEGVHATAYASAKAGLCRFTDQLAVELAPAGIRVNCLQPEQTWSPERIAEVEREERRTGQPHPDRASNHSPEDSAELALWLVSEASEPLTGRTVSVNDRWWRDPGAVREVAASVHAACLRRIGPDGKAP